MFLIVKKKIVTRRDKNFLDSEREREGENQRSIVPSLDSFFKRKCFFGIWMETMYRMPTFSAEGKSCSGGEWISRTWRASPFSITGREKSAVSFENETVQPFPSFFQILRNSKKRNKPTIYPSISSFFKIALRPPSYPRISQS